MSNLTWYLDDITAKKHTFGFIRQFEQSFCVFSPLVGQLYGNYEILPTNPRFDRVVILPNQFEQHDIYTNLLQQATSPTPYFLLPSSANADSFLCLAKRNKAGELKKGEFNQAMKHVLKTHEQFVPILNFTHIKQIGERLPIVPIHHLHIDKMQHLSKFAQNAIRHRVQSKLLNHVKNA